jgi:glycosyltransferase involved in cell wall biosynthesis
MNHLRVAFLLTIAPVYWHPLLSAMTRHTAQFKVFTAGWPDYAKGYEKTFDVVIVGSRKIFGIHRKQKRYGSGVMYLSPLILRDLNQFKPNIIFADGFCVWTVLVLLSKIWQKWRVIVMYDGSSPNVDFTNSKLRLLMRRAMVRYTDGWVTNTAAGLSYLVEILGAPIQKVSIKPYLVPDAQAMLQGDMPDVFPVRKQIVFLLVGQLIPRKGIEEVLETCSLLSKQGYSNFTVWIIGEGWQKNELINLSKTKGVEAQIFWLGQVPYHQLGFYFMKADVFIFPTLEDVWGMAVTEAMSFGKPILCSQWAGTSELIINENNGYQFDPHQPNQLARLMQQYINFPEKISLMGMQSKHIMCQHTVEAAAHLLSKIATEVSI